MYLATQQELSYSIAIWYHSPYFMSNAMSGKDKEALMEMWSLWSEQDIEKKGVLFSIVHVWIERLETRKQSFSTTYSILSMEC